MKKQKLATAYVVGFILGSLIMNAIPYYIWNWIMTAKFDAPSLSFWEMYGLMILTHCLFGRVNTVKNRG